MINNNGLTNEEVVINRNKYGRNTFSKKKNPQHKIVLQVFLIYIQLLYKLMIDGVECFYVIIL